MANVVDFAFTDTSDPSYSFTGQFTVTPGLGGVDLVTGVTGTVDTPYGVASLDGVVPVGYFLSPNYPDNLLYTQDDAHGPGTSYVDPEGIGVYTNGGGSVPTIYFAFFDLFGGEVHISLDGGATTSDDSGVFSIVPEPATWTLMLAGFAGLGAALRSRRRLAAA